MRIITGGLFSFFFFHSIKTASFGLTFFSALTEAQNSKVKDASEDCLVCSAPLLRPGSTREVAWNLVQLDFEYLDGD